MDDTAVGILAALNATAVITVGIYRIVGEFTGPTTGMIISLLTVFLITTLVMAGPGGDS